MNLADIFLPNCNSCLNATAFAKATALEKASSYERMPDQRSGSLSASVPVGPADLL